MHVIYGIRYSKCPKILNNKVSEKKDKKKDNQTVQTKVRLLLKEQSDQCLHCLPFH